MEKTFFLLVLKILATDILAIDVLAASIPITCIRLYNKPCDEVLGAAQFTERTMHKCQKLSKVVIS